jgi:threonine synthase
VATIDHFECSNCGDRLSADEARTVCPRDGGPLYVRYDFTAIRGQAKRPSPNNVAKGVWRYSAVLPDAEPVTRGEGLTPLLRSRKHSKLFIKDEGLNPTGSCEARGTSVAVSMARHYGRKGVAIYSGGDAAVATAAYSAAAGLKAKVFLPNDAPFSLRAEVEAFGAEITLVDGEVGDCHDRMTSFQSGNDWVDLSAFEEPFRVEGLKTIGYEIAEGLGWRLPHAVLCVHGDGLLPRAIGKAFLELRLLEWIDASRTGCIMSLSINHNTLEYNVIHEVIFAPGFPGELPIEISNSEMMSSIKELATEDGILVSPEGGAAMAGYKSLLNRGAVKESDEIILINPASGYKHLHLRTADVASRVRLKLPASRNIGGIIGPY